MANGNLNLRGTQFGLAFGKAVDSYQIPYSTIANVQIVEVSVANTGITANFPYFTANNVVPSGVMVIPDPSNIYSLQMGITARDVPADYSYISPNFPTILTFDPSGDGENIFGTFFFRSPDLAPDNSILIQIRVF